MKVYFTFGTDEQFPYTNGYIVVDAADREQALAYYRSRFPDIREGVVNCAFMYYEGVDDEAIRNLEEGGNRGVGCHEYIDLAVEQNKEAEKAHLAQAREKYLAFLKEEIAEYCNKNGCYKLYYDYRDELSPDDVLQAYRCSIDKNYPDGIPFSCFLEEKLYELNTDGDSYFIDEVEKDINSNEDEDVRFAYENSENGIYEDLTEAGYGGIDVNLADLLSNTRLKVNVMFGTPSERDFDMGAVVHSYGSYDFPDLDNIIANKEYGFDYTDNMLTYLIHQQGHSVKEVYDCLFDNPRGYSSGDSNTFVKSVVNEITNNPSEAMSELTCLVELSGQYIVDFFDALSNEDNNKHLVFDKSVEIGLFNEWSGGGSLLEVQLDKPFVVPVSYVRDIQIEGAGQGTYQIEQLVREKWKAQEEHNDERVYQLNNKIDYEGKKYNNGYSVDEVYGLVGSCWRDCVSYTDKAPELYQEDVIKAVGEVNAFVKEREQSEDEVEIV